VNKIEELATALARELGCAERFITDRYFAQAITNAFLQSEYDFLLNQIAQWRDDVGGEDKVKQEIETTVPPYQGSTVILPKRLEIARGMLNEAERR
jgi:hypothetical protein